MLRMPYNKYRQGEQLNFTIFINTAKLSPVKQQIYNVYERKPINLSFIYGTDSNHV